MEVAEETQADYGKDVGFPLGDLMTLAGAAAEFLYAADPPDIPEVEAWQLNQSIHEAWRICAATDGFSKDLPDVAADMEKLVKRYDGWKP